MIRLLLTASTGAVLILSNIAIAQADICGNLQSQLRTAQRGGGQINPEVAQLLRRLAAIRGLEKKRQCSPGRSAGGFFNPCRDLANSRAEAQRKIDHAAKARGGAAAISARLAALGCRPAQPKQRQPGRSQSGRGPAGGGMAILFCVRPLDGYFFPAPNSQFVGESAYRNTRDRCRFICNDSDMDVYKLDDISEETEEMVSVKGGKPYKDLPRALAYRDAPAFRACDLQRYSLRVHEARMKSVTPFNMMDVAIPWPTPRPDMQTYASISRVDESSVRGEAPSDGEPQQVRMVGPAFFPE